MKSLAQKRTLRVFEVMHMEKVVAEIATNGKVRLCNPYFMPYDLYLEEEDENDIDILVNNINNFQYWCASRVLSLDRKFAKDILNSIGMSQAVTDKDRAEIALSYHCVSLTDVYWVRAKGEAVSFSAINLYDHPLNEAIVDLDTLEICKELDPVTYYGMNILDYLTGNTDRHSENWGFLVDNETNRYISLYPIMDFNQCFLSYDDIEGAGCQTAAQRGTSQREAAIEAVMHIGLRQKRRVDLRLFGDWHKEAEMFERRLQELKR